MLAGGILRGDGDGDGWDDALVPVLLEDVEDLAALLWVGRTDLFLAFFAEGHGAEDDVDGGLLIGGHDGWGVLCNDLVKYGMAENVRSRR